MNKILGYAGIIIILLGVLFLGLHHLDVIKGNGSLVVAAILFVVGLGVHIFCNKRLEE